MTDPLCGNKWQVRQGDCIERLRELPDNCVQCCVTSPPYWGLRDYGTAEWEGGDPECEHFCGGQVEDSKAPGAISTGVRPGCDASVCRKCGARRVDAQLGLERTPEEYVARMVEVFREVKRVLRDDGCVFLNLGDSYYHANPSGPHGVSGDRASRTFTAEGAGHHSSQSSCEYVIMREDLTREEVSRVSMEMFGVRIVGDKAACEGPVCEMLSQAVSSYPCTGGPGSPSEGIEGVLSKEQDKEACQSTDEATGIEVGSDRDVGREVCLLRRDCDGVSNGGSHQRGRCGTQESVGRELTHQFDPSLSGHQTAGVPAEQVSGVVFQLQLRERVLGILSTHVFKRDTIPHSIAGYFRDQTPPLKPKDLVGIPWRVAFALQADGWYLRSDIIWHKPNPMPESVTDRPTSAHEYVFLLSKAQRYYYDAVAVMEPAIQAGRVRADRIGGASWDCRQQHSEGGEFTGSAGRNRRSVWTIATQPYREAHFATYPEALVEPCVLAGSSDQACSVCGAAWVRQVERTVGVSKDCPKTQAAHEARGGVGKPVGTLGKSGSGRTDGFVTTTGFAPGCDCGAETCGSLVLDPFCGSGTTGAVAVRLGRRFLGIELNPEYVAMSERRIGKAERARQPSLFAALLDSDVTP